MSASLDGRIAVVLGWKDLKPNVLWRQEHDFLGIPPGGLLNYVPRWSSDLNLMWELEGEIAKDGIDWYRYLHMLMAECWPNVHEPEKVMSQEKGRVPHIGFLVHATAEQKARAWLQVMEGKA